MAVTVNSLKLQRRLRDAAGVYRIAPYTALTQIVHNSLDRISDRIRAEWSDNNQVGFDVDNFLNIIQHATLIPGGSIGILNQEEMGDAEAFERIRGIPGLWHQGTGAANKFSLFVNQQGMFFDQVAELASARKNLWSGQEPQWFLIEYGTTGYPGAYDPQPPALTITTTAMTLGPMIRTTVETTLGRMLRARGVYT